MLSGMQSLLDLGVCREMPVVGFINGVLILGIIVSPVQMVQTCTEAQDEITRQPLNPKGRRTDTESVGPTQTSLTAFFSPTKPRPPKIERTHKLKISDSKTRASGTLPRESDTTAGQLQVMLYKELFDAMLTITSRKPEEVGQSSVDMSFEQVFVHLGLVPDQPFSEAFLRQSQPIVLGNMLTRGAGEATCLNDMVQIWGRYVEALGLGLGGGGKSEDHLELVYRRAGGQKKGKGKRKRQVAAKSEGLPNDAPLTLSQEEERQLQLAIAQSLEANPAINTDIDPVDAEVLIEAKSFLDPPAPKAYTEEEREKEEDAIALEVELAYRKSGEIHDAGETIPVRASQDHMSPSQIAPMEVDETPIGMIPEEIEDDDPKSGGIIGRHRFKYNAKLLKDHLQNVMSYWHGQRQPSGVGIEDTRRCGWCEFEDGCEWR
jgi:exonuclease V